MILLLGSKRNSTLSFLAQKARELGENAIYLAAEDLCHWTSLRHAIQRQGEVSSAWQIPVQIGDSWSSQWIDPNRVKCVINFLGAHLSSQFDNFEGEDRIFAKFECQAGLLFSLSQFPHVINPPRGGRLCGFARSLIQQWLFVRETCLDVAIPTFYYGPLDHEVLAKFDPEKTIFTHNIYKSNIWRPQKMSAEDLSGANPDTNQLVYQRPDGVPIIATFALGRIWINQEVDQKTKALIETVSETLARELDLNLSTNLFFYDLEGETLTFASVTPSASVEYLSSDNRQEFAHCLLQ